MPQVFRRTARLPLVLARFGHVYMVAAALALFSGVSATAQVPEAGTFPISGSLTSHQTAFQLRAGESAKIATPVLRSITAVSTLPKLRFPVRASVEPDGQSVRFTAPPTTPKGTYVLTFAAVDSAGAVRTGAIHLRITPMQLPRTSPTTTGVPVVLLNGWQAICTTTESTVAASVGTFGQLAYQLQDQGLPVAFFNNCSYGDIQIESLGAELGTFLNSLTYTDGTPILQFDLVTHSMGGLIARAYLAGLQDNGSPSPPVNPKVRKMVMIAPPNFGSFQAPDLGIQASEMIPGSAFLYNLARWNQGSDDLRGVDALAVVGNAGTEGGLPNASDGVVSLTSGSLGFTSQASQDPARTRIVPYCHVDPDIVTSLGIGVSCSGAGGIADVTDDSQLSGQIVSSFLAGTSDWMSIGGTPTADPYLSVYGGVFFAVESSAAQYLTDLSAVSFGTVSLQNGGANNTVFYDEFIAGTGTFQAVSASLGSVTYGPLTLPIGHYSTQRAKFSPAISGVTPLLNTTAVLVQSGGTIAISGVGFGQSCSACQVFASDVPLQVSSWSDSGISAYLPGTFTGLVTIAVQAAAGSDAINIMAAQASAITVAPANVQFAYTIGGTIPASQSIEITNSGGGTLAWSATTNAPWLSVLPSSGTAPGTISVAVAPSGLSVGTYNGTVQISSAGASDSPVSISVALSVAARPATLTVSPQVLTFNYTVGSAAPAAQSVSVTNGGGGTLAWTASTSATWVGLSAASGTAPATLSVSVNPANLAAGSYPASVQITSVGATGSPVSVSVTLAIQAAPPAVNITAVADGASFQSDFASATWVSIFGTNLSQTTRGWQASDFVGALLPTSLSGVSVTINGLPAYVEYISPTQINVLAPDDSTLGPVQVQVTAPEGTSNSFTAQKQQLALAFFTIGGGYIAALHANYTLVGKPNLLPGVVTQPAKPGEIILVYATGFGPTNPPAPSAQLVATPAMLANSVQVTIGGAGASVGYAGLVEAGLYQLNVTVPNVPDGDAVVLAQIGNVQTQAGVLITVGQ